MADTQHLQENSLLRQIRRERRRLIAKDIGLVVATGMLTPALGALVGLVLTWKYPKQIEARTAVLASGYAGEATVQRILERLPQDYVLFNQLQVPHPSPDNLGAEIDFLVVAPNELFVIEVKNNGGRIRVDLDPRAREWKVERLSGYTSTLRNPIGQVRRQTRLLVAWLREQGIRAPVTPVVAFTGSCELVVEPEKVPPVQLLSRDTLEAAIRLRAGRRPWAREETLAALERLRREGAAKGAQIKEKKNANPRKEPYMRREPSLGDRDARVGN